MTFGIEYADVEQVIGGAAKETGWVAQEFVGLTLNDKRLDSRLVSTAAALAASPTVPINGACKGAWAPTKAAYRLFDNEKVTPAALLKPHIDATVRRMVACEDTVLAIQDSVFISYKDHPKVAGIGPIGKDNKDRGLVMHNAIAFTTKGVPLGILSQRIWARKEISQRTKQEKVARSKSTPTEEKESFKWIEALRQTRQRTPPNVRVVTLADRESDFYDFIAAANAKGAKSFFVIRAVADRNLSAAENEGFDKISEALVHAPLADTISVDIVGNQKRSARTATIEIRYVNVTLPRPQRSGAAKIATASLAESVEVTAISAVEVNLPEGVKPDERISWVLLTNLGVTTAESAIEKVRWYAQRWGIETWHRTLKSGFKVEKCLLETGARLKRYLTVCSIIATRLMHITYLARVMPDLPCTAVLTEDQWRTLHLLTTKTKPPQAPTMTMKEAVAKIAALGGHLGRKSDAKPGMMAMWRGWLRLEAGADMLHAIDELYPGLITNTS